MITWLLEDSFHEDTDEISRILRDFGDKVIRDTYFELRFRQGDFDNVKWSEKPLMTIGTLNLCRYLDSIKGIDAFPVHFCTFKNYLCSTYYSKFQRFLLNNNYIWRYFKELSDSIGLINKVFDSPDKIFIRPNDGGKCFAGSVVTMEKLKAFHDTNIEFEYVTGEELCLLSSISPIDREYRIFCTIDRPITGSLYKRQDKVEYSADVPQEILDFAQSVLYAVKWAPDPVFCMDIATHPDNDTLSVVELNSFSASGFYHSDKRLLLEEVRRQTLLEYESHNNDDNT